MIARADVTGVILCGGEGRRMGGVQKALLPLHGQPLVAHVAARLAPQVARIVVSANEEADAYAAYGEVVPDRIPGRGPLGGLQSALRVVDTPWVLCTPGDAPRLAPTLVARLAAVANGHDAVSAHDGERRQPLFLLVRTTVRDHLDAWLEHGGRAVRDFLDAIDVVEATLPDLAPSFANVNTPSDLDHLTHEADASS